MTREQLQDEGNFRASTAILGFMLKNGWLNEKEFRRAGRELLRRYQPVIGSLHGINDTIRCP